MAPRPGVSFTFSEGHYFDLWMIVHLLSGVAGGFSNVFWGLSPVALYALAATMMIVWELIERAQGVRESWSNVALDVFVGLAGVWLATTIAARLSSRGAVLAFVLTLSVGIVLGTLGALAAKRRKRAS